MMDNPVSWFILLICFVAIICVVASIAFNEMEKYRDENDKFFEDREYHKRGK